MSLGEGLIRVYEAILRLKLLRRTGWIERGVEGAESVADHSYAVALLSVILADLRGLDPAEAAWMALIHDLPEAFTGDLTPEEKRGVPDLRERELAVVSELAKALPGAAAEKLLSSWREYAEGSSEAARLVRDVDKLEMGLQALEYLRAGFQKAGEIYESALREIRDPELREVLRRLGGGLA